MTEHPLVNGLSICIWIYIERQLTFQKRKLTKLFTIHHEGQGGVESILMNNRIYYRTLDEKYEEPN